MALSTHGLVVLAEDATLECIKGDFYKIKCSVIAESFKGKTSAPISLDILGSANELKEIMSKDMSAGRPLDIAHSDLVVTPSNKTAQNGKPYSPFISLSARASNVKPCRVVPEKETTTVIDTPQKGNQLPF